MSFVAILMIFVTNINIVLKLTDDVVYACNGIQVTFGFKDGNLEVYSFSIMNLITYICLIAGFVCVLLKLSNAVKSKIVDFVAICLFIVSGVFFFLMPSFAVCPYANSLVSLNLGVGAIIGGILAILSACVVLVKALMKK